MVLLDDSDTVEVSAGSLTVEPDTASVDAGGEIRGTVRYRAESSGIVEAVTVRLICEQTTRFFDVSADDLLVVVDRSDVTERLIVGGDELVCGGEEGVFAFRVAVPADLPATDPGRRVYTLIAEISIRGQLGREASLVVGVRPAARRLCPSWKGGLGRRAATPSTDVSTGGHLRIWPVQTVRMIA